MLTFVAAWTKVRRPAVHKLPTLSFDFLYLAIAFAYLGYLVGRDLRFQKIDIPVMKIDADPGRGTKQKGPGHQSRAGNGFNSVWLV